MNPKIREILRFLVMFPMVILSCSVKLIVDRPNGVFSVWVNGTLEGQNLQGCDDPYNYDGLAVSGRYTQTTDNFDDVNTFEATMLPIYQTSTSTEPTA